MTVQRLSVLAVLALLLPVASYSAGRDSAAVASTQIKLITPFQNGHLGIGVAVTQQGNGKCFAASATSPSRPDAWRCSMGNSIL